jgi:hypothetical protein
MAKGKDSKSIQELRDELKALLNKQQQQQHEIDRLNGNELRDLYDKFKGGGGTTPKPTEGTVKPGGWGASPDATTWKVTSMKSPADQFKVVDSAGKNVATNFSSQTTAQGYIDYYKANPTQPPDTGCPPGQHKDSSGNCVPDTTPPPGPIPTGNLRIYKPKVGGRIKSKVNVSGSMADQSGIRYNIANDHDLVERESTWYGKVTKFSNSTNDHVSPKIGSHGSTGEGCCLLEASVDWAGSVAHMRTEGPHPNYHQCNGGQTFGAVPAIPLNKDIAYKAVQWKKDGAAMTEFYYDYNPDVAAGKFNWIKYASIYDKPTACGISILDSAGNIPGPAKAQDTMRLNGATTPADWFGEIVEIEVINGVPTPASGGVATTRKFIEGAGVTTANVDKYEVTPSVHEQRVGEEQAEVIPQGKEETKTESTTAKTRTFVEGAGAVHTTSIDPSTVQKSVHKQVVIDEEGKQVEVVPQSKAETEQQ